MFSTNRSLLANAMYLHVTSFIAMSFELIFQVVNMETETLVVVQLLQSFAIYTMTPVVRAVNHLRQEYQVSFIVISWCVQLYVDAIHSEWSNHIIIM